MVAPAEAASFKNGAPMAEIGARCAITRADNSNGILGGIREIAMATTPATPAEKMTGMGLAGGLVISALLDTLHSKGISTPEESRKVLDAALASVGPCAESREGFEATQVIGLLRVRFT